MRKLTLITFMLAVSLTLPVLAQDSQNEDQAYIRIAHLAPEMAALNVAVEGNESSLDSVEYRDFSEWTAVPAGQHTLNLRVADDTSLVPVEVDLLPGSWTTFVVTGSTDNDTFSVEAVEEKFDEMLPGTAYTTLVNAIQGTTNVDFVRDTVTYVPNLFPPGGEETNWFGLLDDTDSYTFSIVDTQNPETVLAELPETKFNENEAHLIAAIGTADTNDDADLEIIWDSTTMAEVAMLRGELEVPGTIVQALQAEEGLLPIVDAIERVGLTDTLSAAGPYTLFVPAEFVIDQIPQEILNDDAALRKFLQFHIVEGDLRSQDVFKAGTLTSLNGDELTIEERGENGFVNDAQIINVNIPATNGTIHIINQPLIPDSLASG